jgi:hypothetical protein
MTKLYTQLIGRTYSPEVRIKPMAYMSINSMVQHSVALVLQKFINLHRTQLQSYLFISIVFNSLM